ALSTKLSTSPTISTNAFFASAVAFATVVVLTLDAAAVEAEFKNPINVSSTMLIARGSP
ncbi:MAG: hypothetical protein HGA25_09530, partial [Clostridiales bacterium]|nr:hypothetical protein [Clostridiales bacterium]